MGCLIHIPEEGKVRGDVDDDGHRQVSDLVAMTVDPLVDHHEAIRLAAIASRVKSKQSPQIEPVNGSFIEFFKNGQSLGHAFDNINKGYYYPAVSLYYGAKVKFITGPISRFKAGVPAGARPLDDVYEAEILPDLDEKYIRPVKPMQARPMPDLPESAPEPGGPEYDEDKMDQEIAHAIKKPVGLQDVMEVEVGAEVAVDEHVNVVQ